MKDKKVIPPKVPDEVRKKKLPKVFPPDPRVIKKVMEDLNLKAFSINPNVYTPEEVNELVKKFEGEGIKVESSSSSTWECDVLYSGWVLVNNIDEVRWYAHECSTFEAYDCNPSPPSESNHCDIHYEAWMYFENEGTTTRGLIDFPGCEPANNCGGDCGSNNTMIYTYCILEYTHLPLDSSYFYIYATYTLSKTPAGDCLKCDCITVNPTGECPDNPQMFIVDISQVEAV